MYTSTIYITLISVSIQAINSQRSPSSGWSTTFYSAIRSMVIENSNQIPESLTYQPSSGLVAISNTVNGEFFGIPIAISKQPVTYLSSNMIQLSSSNESFGTFGLVADPGNDTNIWAAISLRPPTTTSICAFELVDSLTNRTIGFYDFQGLRNKELGYCFVNDLAIVMSQAVYATDFWGYQVYMLNLTTGEQSILNNNQSLLCGGTICTGSTSNGPNGIVLYTDASNIKWLLIVVVPNRLIKMNTRTGDATVIEPGINTPQNAIYNLDGMTLFDQGSRDSVLYAVGKVPGSQGTVQVLTSTDEWSTFELRQVYNANCADQSDTAVRMAGSTVLTLCNNNFAVGIDYITVLNSVGGNPIASTLEVINFPSMVPESFTYDPNRNMLVVGSLSDGTIRGVPFNSLGEGAITYDARTMHTYIPSGTDGIYSTAGIQLAANSSLSGNGGTGHCYAYVCMGGYPPNPNNNPETGLYLVDLCEDKVASFVSLPPAVDGSFANDVTVLGDVAFVTDFLGDQVWAVTVTDTVLSNPRVVLTGASCARYDPSFCVDAPDGIVSISTGGSRFPNFRPFLIISMLNTGLMKFVPSTGELLRVNDATGVLFGFDGMVLSHDQTILYGTRNGDEVYETVFAMTSCDNWANASLVYSFQLNCGGSNAPAVALVTNSNSGQEDLVILCNDNFGPGPYTIQRVPNVASVIANQPLCNYDQDVDVITYAPTMSPLFRLPTPSSDSQSFTTADIVATTLGALTAVACLSAVVYYAFIRPRKKKNDLANSLLN